MNEAKTLTLVGMVSGLALQEGVNELVLNKARVFRNPAAVREPGGPPEIGANTPIYSEEGENRHFVGEVVTYLIESEIEVPGGALGHAIIKGSGAVAFQDTEKGGISLSMGTEPNSQASVAVPVGATWNTPALMQAVFEGSVLPLRLLTKARILVFPVGVLARERKHDLMQSGVNNSCPQLVGSSLAVELSKDDCDKIQDFSNRITKVDLADFQVPIAFYSRSFYEVDLVHRGLSLITALESLLSENPESIAYKLAFRASCLTTTTEAERWDTFGFVKKAYRYSNDLVHGKKRGISKAIAGLDSDINRLENLIRMLIRLACLPELEPVALGSGNNANLRNEDSIDEYILTQHLAQKAQTPLALSSEVGKLWKGISPF